MNFSFASKFLTSALLLASASSMAFEITCVRDERPVDGDLAKIVLSVTAQGAGVATIEEEGNSPFASHSEKTELRALQCKNARGPFLSVNCTGPYQLTVEDLEVAPGPTGTPGFSHIITVHTTFHNKSFTFGGKTSSMPNSCTSTN